MKKKVMLGVIAAMVVSMSASVYAGPSIGQIVPEDPVIESSTATVPEGAKLVVDTIEVEKEDTLTNYTKLDPVKELIKAVNEEGNEGEVKEKVTVENLKTVLEELKVEDVHNVETKSGDKIDLTEYKFTTPFVDLALKVGDNYTRTLEGEMKVKITFEAAKQKKAEDLVIMLVNPETGKVVFITLGENDLDPETGEITAELPFLGAMTILDKSAVGQDNITEQNAESTAE